MRESEFINMFQYNRPNDKFWEEMSLIQTAIKSKTGCGVPVYVHFKAPLDMTNPEAVIDYGADRYPSDYTLLKLNDDVHYALKQCAKMATHI